MGGRTITAGAVPAHLLGHAPAGHLPAGPGLGRRPRVDGIRRGLQIALGGLWLLDAALQYQLSMFTRTFPAMMLAPAGMGEPAFVSGPVLAASRLIAGQVVP